MREGDSERGAGSGQPTRAYTKTQNFIMNLVIFVNFQQILSSVVKSNITGVYVSTLS